MDPEKVGPELTEFIIALVACGLLACCGEAYTIARQVSRIEPDWGFMRDVVATRAAHKKYAP